MRWPRRFVSLWWLTLLVVSCLLARPLHEALDLVQAGGKGGGARAVGMLVPEAGVLHVALTASQGHAPNEVRGEGRGDARGHGVDGELTTPSTTSTPADPLVGDAPDSPDGPDDDESKPGACAWCLMLSGQAQAPASVPVMLIQHAEASPPPVLLQPGVPAGRCLLAASPRGPPRA